MGTSKHCDESEGELAERLPAIFVSALGANGSKSTEESITGVDAATLHISVHQHQSCLNWFETSNAIVWTVRRFCLNTDFHDIADINCCALLIATRSGTSDHADHRSFEEFWQR